MFQFEVIHKKAIAMAGKLLRDTGFTPVAQLAYCTEHEIPRNYAHSAFVALTKRSEYVSSAEMREMGLDNAAVVGIAREWYRAVRPTQDLLFFLATDPDEEFAKSIVRAL
jgi:hypothetical protein